MNHLLDVNLSLLIGTLHALGFSPLFLTHHPDCCWGVDCLFSPGGLSRACLWRVLHSAVSDCPPHARHHSLQSELLAMKASFADTPPHPTPTTLEGCYKSFLPIYSTCLQVSLFQPVGIPWESPEIKAACGQWQRWSFSCLLEFLVLLLFFIHSLHSCLSSLLLLQTEPTKLANICLGLLGQNLWNILEGLLGSTQYRKPEGGLPIHFAHFCCPFCCPVCHRCILHVRFEASLDSSALQCNHSEEASHLRDHFSSAKHCNSY